MNIQKINPVMPKDAADPADQKSNLRKAKSTLDRRYGEIYKKLRDYIYSVQRVQTANATASYRLPTKHEKAERTGDMWAINNRVLKANKYIYELDAIRTFEFIDSLMREYLLDNENLRTIEYSNRWWLISNLDEAYTDAIDTYIDDSIAISPESVVGESITAKLNQLTPDSIMMSPPVLRRLSLMHGRVFNEMKGLSESSASDLGRVLTQGMIDGNGVQDIARAVKKRVSVSMSRAMRIARTEILNSYRTATRTEVDDLNEEVYGDSDWQQQMLWFSALAASSRSWHVSRHGLVYTTEEVQEFYSVDANPINCMCSQSLVLVNKKTGEVLQSSLLKRMKKQKEAWRAGMARKL
ncbi:putative minor head protein [Pseudoalteromonas phage C7]|uniref:putative minor head protein n=1 Tax=Pseudoalteromonas phage C7 TaxID=2510494 RepID=UPI0010198044|nr:putative minor head protein [Pseudoalteromonas phage C7]QAY18019.1 putative minor head protein [Pseudoalteromonas phage C7]